LRRITKLKKKKLFTLIGSVCLSLVLAALLLPACAPAAPEEVAEEVAEMEDELAAEKAKVKGLEDEVGDLEDELATLKKPAEVYKWKMQSIYVPGSLPYIVSGPEFVQDVEIMSGGRISIEVYPPGALSPSPEIVEALGKGMFELSATAGAYYGGIIPEAYIEFGLPGGPAEFGDWMRFFREEGFMSILQEGYAEHNAWVIGTYPDSCHTIISTRPIRTIDDLKGLKIRATGVDGIWFEKLGASPMFLPLEELYTGLAMGTVDASKYAGPAVHWDLTLMEVAKYEMFPSSLGPQMAGNLVFSLDTWKALPDDLKHINEMAAWDAGYRYYTQYQIENLKAIERMKEEYGVEVMSLPAAELAKVESLREEVWDEVAAKGPRAAKGIAILKELMVEIKSR